MLGISQALRQSVSGLRSPVEAGGDKLTAAVSQKVVSFELNRDFIPEQLEDFFSDDVHQNWVDLVPRTSALPSPFFHVVRVIRDRRANEAIPKPALGSSR